MSRLPPLRLIFVVEIFVGPGPLSVFIHLFWALDADLLANLEDEEFCDSGERADADAMAGTAAARVFAIFASFRDPLQCPKPNEYPCRPTRFVAHGSPTRH